MVCVTCKNRFGCKLEIFDSQKCNNVDCQNFKIDHNVINIGGTDPQSLETSFDESWQDGNFPIDNPNPEPGE